MLLTQDTNCPLAGSLNAPFFSSCSIPVGTYSLYGFLCVSAMLLVCEAHDLFVFIFHALTCYCVLRVVLRSVHHETEYRVFCCKVYTT